MKIEGKFNLAESRSLSGLDAKSDIKQAVAVYAFTKPASIAKLKGEKQFTIQQDQTGKAVLIAGNKVINIEPGKLPQILNDKAQDLRGKGRGEEADQLEQFRAALSNR